MVLRTLRANARGRQRDRLGLSVFVVGAVGAGWLLLDRRAGDVIRRRPAAPGPASTRHSAGNA